VHGAHVYSANGEGRRVARGKMRHLGARRRSGKGVWAWGGVQPGGGALAWTPMRPARGVACDVTAWRGALAELFQTR
jgi:hypothetical protein